MGHIFLTLVFTREYRIIHRVNPSDFPSNRVMRDDIFPRRFPKFFQDSRVRQQRPKHPFQILHVSGFKPLAIDAGLHEFRPVARAGGHRRGARCHRFHRGETESFSSGCRYH